jgi:2-keto-4-pentenoate hydratase
MTKPPAPSDVRVGRGMTAQLELRRRLINAGARPIGWKVGFGAPAAMARLGIATPLVGFMLDRNIAPSGASVPLAGWVKPAAEPEIAVEMRAALPGGATPSAAADAIGALGPAIELADIDHPPDDVETILAGNIFHRNVVFGPRDRTRAGGRIEGLRARVRRNGAAYADTTELEANTGKLIDVATCGERLAAGDVIIAGSVVAPIFLGDGDGAIDYALDPIGSVAVTFSRP